MDGQQGWLRLTLQQGGRPFVRVTSNSMAPLLKKGDFAQIAAVDVTDLHDDDIVVFAHQESLISHRLWRRVGAANETLLTRGDRLDHFDPPHSTKDVLGRVIARRRDGRILNIQHGIGRQARKMTGHLARFELRLAPAQPHRVQQSEKLGQGDQGVAARQIGQWAHFLLGQTVYRCAQITVALAELAAQLTVGNRDAR
ncbi:MAG: S24/S26 family peptidase [Candidatus Promineifilaceae bacterium]|nr:S24/S26 family peptidase [Candidatus Promineifilaceae bacterium]